MEKLKILIFLCLCFVTLVLGQPSIVDPRGARPIEHGHKADKCATQKEWPFCTDDDWGPKCPSGCRIQGLLDKNDHELLKKIKKIRDLLDQNRAKHRSTDQASKQTYDYLKDKLTTDAGKDSSYYDLAQDVRQRIVDMKITIDRQVRVLHAMKDRVKDQVIEMQRLEVDIDIKLRSCKGSCLSYAEFSVDRESYVSLDKQIDQLESRSGQSVETVRALSVMKSRSLMEAVVDSRFKAGPEVSTETTTAQQRQDFFPDVNTIQLTLEVEGSTAASAATVSKVPGTTYTSSSSSSYSSSSQGSQSGSTKSITEIGTGDAGFFGGFEGHDQPATAHVSTHGVSCTKRTRTTVVQTADGPVERTEEVIEGGAECQGLDFSKGGTTSSSSSSSSSTSSSSSSTSFTSTSKDIKGSLFGDFKGGFENPFGSDFGGFFTNAGDDDVPDFQARSVKNTRIERQADYEGKVCIKLKQQSKDGPQSLGHTNSRRRRCPPRAEYPLCSDDDWVTKCPSGCRLQGLMSEMEREVEVRLRKVCETAQRYEDRAEESMRTTSHIYYANRRAIINTYVAELKYVDFAEDLARNLTSLWKRSDELSQQLKELHGKTQQQMEDMYRAEVDIDIKLRACEGSCHSTQPFNVDHSGYQTLQTDMNRLANTPTQRQKSPPAKHIPHIKLQPVDVGPVPSKDYKTIPMVQKQLLTQFEDIEQNQVVLEDILDELLEDSADVEVLGPSELE